MTNPTAYISATEADGILAAAMLSTDPLLVGWDAASAGDKGVALTHATEDIDACPWIGRVADEDQPLAWPRIDPRKGGETILPDPDAPAPGTAQVADLPRDLRRACAIQAAWRLRRMQDVDPLAFVEEAAARGVTATSGGGQSAAIDAEHARSPWAALHPRVQRLLSQFRRMSGDLA